MKGICLGGVVGKSRDDYSSINFIDFVNLLDDFFRYFCIRFEVELFSSKDGVEVDEVKIKFIWDWCSHFGSSLLLVSLKADNRSFIPLWDVIDKETNGIVWPFEEYLFCEFWEKGSKFILFEVFLGFDIPSESFLFVHCSYINTIDWIKKKIKQWLFLGFSLSSSRNFPIFARTLSEQVLITTFISLVASKLKIFNLL